MSNPVLERLSNDTKKLAHDYIRHEMIKMTMILIRYWIWKL